MNVVNLRVELFYFNMVTSYNLFLEMFVSLKIKLPYATLTGLNAMYVCVCTR